MIALAERGERGDFGEIERLGRESLNEMRELLGALRGDARAPQPTLSQLGDLLGAARLDVQGERRALPDSVELTAYRIVEHAVAATPAGRVRVTLRYRSDGLELEVRGAARDALAVARERVAAHGGTFAVDPRGGLRARLAA